MERVEVGLENLKIHELTATEIPGSNSLEFELRGSLDGVEEETVGLLAGKKLQPIKLVCYERSLDDEGQVSDQEDNSEL